MADGAAWYIGSILVGCWLEDLFEPCKSKGHRIKYSRCVEHTICSDGCLMVMDEAAV